MRKTFKDIAKEMKEKGFTPLRENEMTGFEFEEWLRKYDEEVEKEDGRK